MILLLHQNTLFSASYHSSLITREVENHMWSDCKRQKARTDRSGLFFMFSLIHSMNCVGTEVRVVRDKCGNTSAEGRILTYLCTPDTTLCNCLQNTRSSSLARQGCTLCPNKQTHSWREVFTNQKAWFPAREALCRGIGFDSSVSW